MSVKILIVDDNQTIRQAVRSYLESNTAFDICEASNGKVAVELVRELHPQVVVLDLVMPGLNGLEVARRIAAIAPGTEMIMLTSHFWHQLSDDARRVGIASVVSKADDHCFDRLVSEIKAVTESQSPGISSPSSHPIST